MTKQRWWHPMPWVFLSVWLLLMAVGPTRLFRDPGTFWHTRVGELLWQEGFFRQDPFTFTFSGNVWIPHQWLGEICMAWLYWWGGFHLQLWVTATLLAGIFAFLSQRFLTAGWHPVAVVAAVAVALAAAGTHFHVRPHLMTIVGMTLIAGMLADVETGRIPLRRLGWLIPLLAIWANIHGGALGGWGTLLLTFGGWSVLWLVGGPSPVRHWYDLILLVGVLLLPPLLVLANPYGWDLFRAWQAILDEPILRQIIQEHRPLSASDPAAWPVWLLIAGYGLLLLGLPVRNWRVTWFVPLLWAIQAVERCRHAALFVVVAVPILAAVWPQTYWARKAQSTRPDWFRPGPWVTPCPWRAWILPLSVLLVSLALPWGGIPLPPLHSPGAIPSAKEWPIGVLPVLQAEQHSWHLPARLFNDYRDGGFVIFFAPRYRIFVDDRCELFGGEWLQAFVLAASDDVRATQAIPQWEERYGTFDYALVRHNTPFARYFAARPQQWELLAQDALAAFYRRRP
jgi:hypothetical protein